MLPPPAKDPRRSYASAESIIAALHGRNGMARCPAHDDHNPSLSITSKDGGGVLLHCHTGCSFESVRDALDNRGLWFSEPAATPAHTTTWNCINPRTGKEAVHTRIDEAGGKRFVWPKGTRTKDLIYRAPANTGNGPLVIAEGERAADAVSRLGLDVIGTVGATTIPNPAALADCSGRRVLVWPDLDAPGRRHMANVDRVLKDLDPPPLSVRHLRPERLGLDRAGDDAADWRPGDSVDVLAALEEVSESCPCPETEKPNAGTAPEYSRNSPRNSPGVFRDYSGEPENGPWPRHADVQMAGQDTPKVIIPGLAWEGSISLFYSPAKAGKTTLLADALAARFRGEPFLGALPDDDRPILIVEEMRFGWLKRWLWKRGCPENAALDYMPPSQAGSLEQYVAVVQPSLIIIDTTIALTARMPKGNGGVENDAGKMRSMFERFRELQVGVLAVHHADKAKNGYRGSSDLAAAVDMLIELTGDGDMRRLAYTGGGGPSRRRRG